jgi:hypothetical protein
MAALVRLISHNLQGGCCYRAHVSTLSGLLCSDRFCTGPRTTEEGLAPIPMTSPLQLVWRLAGEIFEYSFLTAPNAVVRKTSS